jgi:hypothetical protein
MAGVEARWERLRARLDALSEVLSRQGTLARKTARGKFVWRVRYYAAAPGGRRMQRSLHVGSDHELVARTRALLEAFRERRQLVRETGELVRLAAAFSAAVRRTTGRRGRVRGRRSTGLSEFC